jgi:hypothetical protein
VRLQAADALSQRPMNTESHLWHTRIFDTDTDDRVRLTLMKNLWTAREKFPDGLEVVKAAAMSDRSEDVRKRAAMLIGSERER